MTIAEQTSVSSAVPAVRTIRIIGLTLGLGALIFLSSAALQGNFLIGSDGRPIANDFVSVVAAGQLARDGKAAEAYNWPTHKQAEVEAIGLDF